MRAPRNTKEKLLLKMKSCDRNKKDRRSGGTFSVNPKIALKGWMVYVVFSLCWQLSCDCVYREAPWFISEWFLSTVWIRSHDRHGVANSESFRFLLARWLCGVPSHCVRQNSGTSPLHLRLLEKQHFAYLAKNPAWNITPSLLAPPRFLHKRPKEKKLDLPVF